MRSRFTLLVVAAAVTLPVLFASSAGAVTNGQYDGNGHPYVAYLDNGVFAWSGTILSPTVIVTAAHCFSTSTSALGNNTITGAPIVRVSFDPNLINDTNAQRNWFYGTSSSTPGSRSARAEACRDSTRTTKRS